MDVIQRQTLNELLTPPSQPCVTLYAPLHPGSTEARKDPVRLKNLLREAEEQLVDRGQRRDAARELLEPLRRLTDGNTPWKYEGRGLAMFLAPRFERSLNLVSPIDEDLFVDNRFHLRPLLPLVSQSERFFLLALSQNEVRFFEGWAGGLIERDFHGPQCFDETTDVNHTERGGKVHEGVVSSFNRRAAQVKGPDRSKEDLRHYVREVATHIDARLKDETAPLVLFAAELLVRLWQEESKYPEKLGGYVVGNGDYLPIDELHARAWPAAEPTLRQKRQEAHEKLVHGRNTPRLAFGVPDVVAAAMHGQVDTLFIDCSRPRWGTIDLDNGRVELHEQPLPGDADLVEVAATETLLRDGDVFPLVPHGDAPHAAEAVLRY